MQQGQAGRFEANSATGQQDQGTKGRWQTHFGVWDDLGCHWMFIVYHDDNEESETFVSRRECR